MMRCRSCGHIYNNYDMIGATCLYCGSTKLAHSSKLGTGTKIGVTIVIVLVFIVVISAIGNNLLETSNNDGTDLIDETITKQPNANTNPIDTSDNVLSSLLSNLNSKSTIGYSGCESSLENNTVIIIDCGKYGSGKFRLPHDHTSLPLYLDDYPYVSLIQNNGVYIVKWKGSYVLENITPIIDELAYQKNDKPSSTIEKQIQTDERSNQADKESQSLDLRSEMSIFITINKVRNEKGISSLQYSLRLAELADKNSQIMANDNEVKHTDVSRNFDCKTIGGLSTIGTAEIATVDQGSTLIFYNVNPELVGERLVDSWLSSKTGHKEAILNPSYRFMGAGVVSSIVDVYGTVEFCP